jgi:D-alanyl-D-alanine carboxypeptidase (penicillin-binding protein 5/6)
LTVRLPAAAALCALALATGAAAQSPGPLAATGATVIDRLTGRTLFEKEAGRVLYPASATKILTALLVIESGSLETAVTIEPADTKVEPSSIGLRPGESVTRLNLLYALMLKSANDAAMALARDNAGSVEAFGERMTLRARELGATDSRFRNPHGLPDPEHVTTARDLALIARTAMGLPRFRAIVATRQFDYPSPAGPLPLRNHNRLLARFPGCTGIKTGYTVAAGQVLASAAQWGTREVVAVVLKTNKPGIWVDSEKLLQFGLTHLAAEPLNFEIEKSPSPR